jgi:hypothetical protein
MAGVWVTIRNRVAHCSAVHKGQGSAPGTEAVLGITRGKPAETIGARLVPSSLGFPR